MCNLIKLNMLKVDKFTVLKQICVKVNKIDSLSGRTCEVVSGMLTLHGRWEIEWLANVKVQK